MKLYISLRDDPKIIGLSDKAFRAYVNALCWCGYHETDGLLAVGSMPPKVLDELRSAGLVDDWTIHNWPKFQRTHAELERTRAERREAGRSGGLAKAKAVANQTPNKMPSRLLSKNVPELELEKELEEEPNPTSAFTEDAHSLNLLLVAALRERGVKRIPGDLRSWEQSAERLLRIDAAPLDEVRRVLAFSQTDPFWSANILSMPKFRAKYDQLRLRMQGGNGRREETSAERVVRLGLA